MLILMQISGKCDTDVAPPSWLKSAGHGIYDYGTAGINLGGSNFCLKVFDILFIRK